MKKLVFSVLVSFSAIGLKSQELKVSSKVEEVTIYHSGALVKRKMSVNLNTGINELILNNISSKIVLSSLELNKDGINVLSKSIVKKISKEDFQELVDRKESLSKQLGLLEAKYNETGFVKDASDLEKIINFYSEKIIKIKKELRGIEKNITDINSLDAVVDNKDKTAFLKLVVSANKPVNTSIDFQYVCGGIGWAPSYEILAENTTKNKISIKYLSKVMNQTGENWNDIAITLSSGFPLETILSLPKPEDTYTLSNTRKNNSYYPNETIENKTQPTELIEKLEGVEYQSINIPTILSPRKLNGKLSLPSNSAVLTFIITKTELPVDYYYYGFPSIDSEPYLVARITGFDTLGFIDGFTTINVQGENVGRTSLKFSENPDSLILPISKDNSIFVKRTEITDKKQFQEGNLLKDNKSVYAYKYTLKNNKSTKIRFELFDEIPVSQTSSTDVTFQKTNGGVIDYQNAQISWNIELKPGEVVEKELIYSIVGGSTRSNRYSKSKVHSSVRSCPSF